MMDFTHLLATQLENDLNSEPGFWVLSRLSRLQRLGLRLAVQMPSILHYRSSTSVSREEMLVKVTKLALGVANTLGVEAGSNAEREPGFELGQSFERRILSAIGGIADAAEKIDHLEDFSSLAKRSVVELLSVIAELAEFDGIDLQGLISGEKHSIERVSGWS